MLVPASEYKAYTGEVDKSCITQLEKIDFPSSSNYNQSSVVNFYPNS